MKKLLTVFAFLMVGLVFSQKYQADVMAQFKDYSALIESKNFEQALDKYGNQEFFNIIPKKQMVALMDQMFNAKEFEFKFYQPEDINVSDNLIKEKGNSWVKISYKQNLDMKFSKAGINNEQILSALQSEFGFGHVKFNSATQYFEIRTDKEAVANSADLKNWKFTVLEKKQIPVLKQIVPEVFLRTLN